MKVVEIFKSIEGEGLRTGLPVVFIRLYGCNLRCSYCDTKYSYKEIVEGEPAPFTIRTVEEIASDVMRFECPNVTITGGEPLIHPGIEKLIDLLLTIGCKVNVETNGTRPVPYKYREDPRIIFTMDCKCPSSGMNKEMNMEFFDSLREWDALKFVVGSQEDLNELLEVRECLRSVPNIFVSPVYGEIELQEIVDFLMMHNLNDVRLQMQLHKIIWDPEERGV